MYDVTTGFLIEMKKPAQKRTIRGTLSGKNFSAKNIVKGSCSIVNQCSDNNNIQIGQVYIGQLKITLRGISNISRKTYKGREIVLYQGLYVGDELEEVLLGHWFIDNASWTTSGVVIVAYDAMTKFDKTSSNFPNYGTLLDYIIFACNACGVDLEYVDEEAVNMTTLYYTYPDNDIETWRDLLSWAVQTAGCNATINRNGNLEIRSYVGKTPVDVYNSKRRLNGGSFSDFDTYYTGISVVNIDSQTTSYYGLPQDIGLTMNLGSNPFLQDISVEGDVGIYRRNVLDAVSHIYFTPCKVGINALMIYDLMDVLTFDGGIIGDGEEINICITKFTWNLNGNYIIECTGSDPSLASAKSKTDKNLAGLLSKVGDDNIIRYYDFTNAEKIAVIDGGYNRVPLADIRYVVKKDTHIDFHAEIKYTLSTVEETEGATYVEENDGKVKIIYSIDGDEIEQYYPVDTNTDGVHLLHLLFFWRSSSGNVGRFIVYAETKDCDIVIDTGECRGFISAQGLLGTEDWDGNIYANDNVEIISYQNNIKEKLHDKINIINIPPVTFIPAERVGKLHYTNNIGRITDSMSLDDTVMIFDTITNLSLLTYTATISNNTFINGDVITPDIYNIAKVEAVSSGVAYYASFDNGTTWKAYSNGGWVEGSSMTATELSDVPQSAWLSPAKIKAEISGTAYLTYIHIEGGHI